MNILHISLNEHITRNTCIHIFLRIQYSAIGFTDMVFEIESYLVFIYFFSLLNFGLDSSFVLKFEFYL